MQNTKLKSPCAEKWMQNGKTEVGCEFIRFDHKPEGVPGVRRMMKGFTQSYRKHICAGKKSSDVQTAPAGKFPKPYIGYGEWCRLCISRLFNKQKKKTTL